MLLQNTTLLGLHKINVGTTHHCKNTRTHHQVLYFHWHPCQASTSYMKSEYFVTDKAGRQNRDIKVCMVSRTGGQ